MKECNLSDQQYNSPNGTQLPNGVYLEFVDFKEEILKVYEPIFLNDLPCVTKEDREKINNLIRTNYDGDKLSIQPSCECGLTKAGRYCPECRQPVLPFSEKPIIPNIWFRPPAGVDTLINPTFWGILRQAFTHNDYCLLDYITITNFSVPPRKHGEVMKLKSLGVKRGFNYFCENFDQIINLLFDCGFYRGTNNNKMWLKELISRYRDKIFTPYLPIPHRIAFVTEKTSVVTYADFSTTGAYNAAMTIAEIDESEYGTSLTTRQNWTIGAINDLWAYHHDQHRLTIGKKEGANRKHIFGTRGNYGGRAVISSLSEEHDYDELHIPWTFAIGMLKIHLFSKLEKLGFTPNFSARFLQQFARKYNSLLDRLLQELIEESKDPELGIKGIPCIFQRNPSLARGSAQCFFITKVKTDPDVNTVSMSVLCLKAPNADFDGKPKLPSEITDPFSFLCNLLVNLSNCFELLKKTISTEVLLWGIWPTTIETTRVAEGSRVGRKCGGIFGYLYRNGRVVNGTARYSLSRYVNIGEF